MSKKSRDIGKRGENIAAKLFSTVYPDAKRNKEGQFVVADQPDVLGVPLWVEVKYWERYPDLYEALDQALKDRKKAFDGRRVVIASKKKGVPRKPWIATMLLSEYVQLLAELEELRSKVCTTTTTE